MVGAEPARRVRQQTQGRDDRRKSGEERRGIVAGRGEAGFSSRPRRAAGPRQRHAENDRRGGHRLGEDAVVGRRGREQARQILARGPPGSAPSALSKLRRSGSAKMKSKAIAAAPSPASLLVNSASRVRGQGRLAERRETLVVDPDDANRRFRIKRRGAARCSESKTKLRKSSSSGGCVTPQGKISSAENSVESR